MIKEYKILSEFEKFEWIENRYDAYVFDLERAVNFLITKGWEPLGGVSSIGTSKSAYCIQAMVLRYEEM